MTNINAVLCYETDAVAEGIAMAFRSAIKRRDYGRLRSNTRVMERAEQEVADLYTWVENRAVRCFAKQFEENRKMNQE